MSSGIHQIPSITTIGLEGNLKSGIILEAPIPLCGTPLILALNSMLLQYPKKGEKKNIYRSDKKISTEVYCEDTGNLQAQYSWLQKDLQATKSRNPMPWVVVFGHRQMYMGPISTHASRLMRLG